MIYCFTLSQVIFLTHFLVALNETATAVTNKTENNTHNTPKGVGVMSKEIEALIWAVGLLVTELVSVLLIAWSLSILYRLACS